MSLPIEDIICILRDGGHLTDPKALQAAAKDLLAAEREVKASKDTTKSGKTRLTILLRSDDPKMQAALAAGAWIVSTPDGDADPTVNTYHGEGLVKRLQAAVVAHNEAPRAKRAKVKRRITTWHDALTLLKSKTIKESGSQIGIKAKGALAEVVVLTTEAVQP